ncbi:glycogen synthase [Kitasatospora cineracea]|uniref:glycogen synthase n=1 Tax=Kitasatospora cineracea TaxID=88074 RepID=UPI0036A6D63E
MNEPNCLYVTQELAPFFAEGGLGQASRALPDALRRDHGIGHDLILPHYPRLVAAHGLRTERAASLRPVGVVGVTVRPVVERLVGHGGPNEVLLVRADHWYDRDGIYRDRDYVEYGDAVARAAFFGACVADWVRVSGRRYDVVHGNDWQSGAALAHLRSLRAGGRRPTLLMNVHNGAYRGEVAAGSLDRLGLPADALDTLRAKAPDRPGLLLLGLLSADLATTGSPGYARELLRESHGTPLGDALARTGLTGVVAGVDGGVWDPAAAGRVSVPFGPASAAAGKRANKQLLQRRTGLREDPGLPVFGLCARLVAEKGIDLALAAVAPLVLAGGAQLVVIGPGDGRYVEAVAELAAQAPDLVHHCPRFDQDLAWLAYAGGDFTLMPSRVEPCGLNQLIAMAYGTVPLVSSVGGLGDTVTDLGRHPGTGTGFVFADLTADAVRLTVRRAVDWLLDRPAEVAAARARMMAQDWSWARTAKETAPLYTRMGAPQP